MGGRPDEGDNDPNQMQRTIQALEQQLAQAQAKIRTLTGEAAGQNLFDRLSLCEQKLDAIFTYSPIAMILASLPEGRIAEVNQAWLDLYGFEREEVIGKTGIELSIYRDAAARAHAIQEAARGIPLRGLTVTNYTKSGERKTISNNVDVIEVAGQKYLLATLEDVSERRQAEEALRQSEMRFRDLADSMPQLVWTARPDGQVDYYNRRSQEYHSIGLTPEQIWEWAPVLHPEDQQATIEAWQRSVETGETYQIEHRVEMSDGSYRWHLSRGAPARDEAGWVTRWYGTATDIHDLKQAEESLQQRNERLKLLSQAAADLLSSENPAAMLAHLFKGLAEQLSLEVYMYYLLGRDQHTLDLMSMAGFSEDLYPSLKKLNLTNSVCGRVASTRQAIVVEDVQHTGEEHFGLIRTLGLTAYVCHPLMAQGHLVGTLSFGTRRRLRFDPAELELLEVVSNLIATAVNRRQDNIALQAYTRQLEASNRDWQEFAFIASHDLQEPLRKIETFGDALLFKSTNLDAAQREKLERMRASADQMRRMVDGLVQFWRLTSQAQPFERVDLSQVVQKVVAELEPQLGEQEAVIEVGKLPTVDADRRQMSELFHNLIENALKFQKPDGQPHVRVYAQPSDLESLAQIVVEDNGIGFDQAYASRMFQPFQRLVGRMEYKGSGMGLAICRRIVERHGGEISVRSQRGQGASFTIHLPLFSTRLSE